ncbi:tetratricopeptide repeat protein [Wenzhouxiangella sp. XN24]|uniref:tetratricopeptide repeat protein n=1 Tax=Wenzhouxiangella sp. XN24 TaxID=2713569 RepID=UPI0013ECB0DF|nr:tetratricopeptide repeat protein [Wenzhouxiangella sp. XN24]NGX16343.1 tetratricopeptide repeat protein [Wenzhouxiangella sp. XN24]
MTLLAELKRRNVIRVAILYVVTAWLLLQAADVGMSALGLPEWTGRMVLLLLGLGFPVALVFSWIYELTPEGLRRDSEIDAPGALSGRTGHKLNVAIVVLLLIAIGLGLADRLASPGTGSAEGLDGDVDTPADTAAGTVARTYVSTVVDAPVRSQASDSSIAVLPFADLSREGDNEYFSDGLTEELLNALAKVRALKVAGRTSSFAYKGRDVDLRVIGEELGVAHLLEGSVRKSGNRLRITAQLIKAEDGYHVWSETYDRELTDVFAIQSDIAGQVVEALEVTLLGEDETRMQAGGTTNVEAYNDYLRGRYLLNQGSRQDTLQEAVAALESALQKDPEFADAWFALGNASTLLVANGWIGAEEGWARIEEAAVQARRHAPQIAAGYMLEGYLLAYRDLQWTEARALMRRAVELEPGNSTISFNYAILLRGLPYYDEGLAAMRRAVQLEPTNLVNQVFLGNMLMTAGRYPEAKPVLQQVLAVDPGFNRAHYYLGVCEYLEGDYAAALARFEAEPLGWMHVTGRALALYKLGRKAEADQVEAELVETFGDRAAYQQAQVAAQRGALDLAFESLERAFVSGDTGVSQLLTDPLVAPLHDDPRYKAALERVNLLQFLGQAARPDQ